MRPDQDDNPAIRVRERLRRWLDATRIGQREFASELGKTQAWLQKVLNSDNQIRLKDLDTIARAMRGSASELVRSEEERYTFELTPTELRVMEHLRRRPGSLDAVLTLLGLPHHDITRDEDGHKNTSKRLGA